jgi:hypothetical protein
MLLQQLFKLTAKRSAHISSQILVGAADIFPHAWNYYSLQ